MRVDELLNDPQFIKFLEDQIKTFLWARRTRMAGEGLRFKRDAFDNLIETNQFNINFLRTQFVEIIEKRSVQTSSVRDAIYIFIMETINKFQLKYSTTSKSN